MEIDPLTNARNVALITKQAKQIAELEKENAALKSELDDYETYGICDCCHNLSDDLVDAGGHMQCKPCTTIAELQKGNAALKAEREWIHVSERLPAIEEDEYGFYRYVFITGSGDVTWCTCNTLAKNYRKWGITHWRPLPEPPNA